MCDSNGTMISADDPLDDALGILADSHRTWAPVVAEDRLVGILSTRDALAAYRRRWPPTSVRSALSRPGGAMIEAEIGPGSPMAGSSRCCDGWPRDAILVSVARGDQVIVPRGDVVLEVGDRLTVFAAPEARGALDNLLAGHPEGGESAP